jgi:SAM-dependent methyltransferase
MNGRGLAEEAVAARHALELQWHEEHPNASADGQISTYKKLVLRRLRERQWAMLGPLAGKRVLDVGCGVGRETVELAQRGARVMAADLSPALVATARRRADDAGVADRIEFKVGAAEDLVPEGERFDVVIGNGVLHHLDIATFKSSLLRLLKPDGVAQFQEPLVHNPLLRLYRRLTPHLHSPTERPLADEDISAFVRGFREVHVDYFNLVGLLLLPAPYVVGRRVSNAMLRWALHCDRVILQRVPALRKFCQYVIIQVGRATPS